MLVSITRRPPFIRWRRAGSGSRKAGAAVSGGRLDKLAYGLFQESFAGCAARLQRDPSIEAPAIELLSAEISGVPLVMPELGGRGSIERCFEGRRRFQLRDVFLRHQLAGPGIYLDIGANIGLTSIPHAIVQSFEAILAVEPEPYNFACLHYNVAANGLADRISLLQVAVGETSGPAGLKRRTRSGTHYLRAHRDDVTEDGRIVGVQMRTVDQIAQELTAPVGLIKCDTQGYEGHVLAGAVGLLRQRRTPWFVELWPAAILRAGGDIGRTVGLIQDSFRWFVDCRSPRPELRRIAQFESQVPAPQSNRFTDFILIP